MIARCGGLWVQRLVDGAGVGNVSCLGRERSSGRLALGDIWEWLGVEVRMGGLPSPSSCHLQNGEGDLD